MTTIYFSGQVGISDGEIPADFAQQVEYTFANLQWQLQVAGAASTMVGVPGLVIPELLVEVEAVAVIEN